MLLAFALLIVRIVELSEHDPYISDNTTDELHCVFGHT